MLIIIGETASGKSTLTEIITLLLGNDAVTAVGLDGIGTQFQEAAMIGKLANISQECRFVSATAVEKLKQLSSGDAVTQDVKHQKGRTYKPTARLVMASNQEPRFADSSEAIWDRLSVLNFPKTVPLNERDRDLVSKIEAELPGVFLMSMEALRRLHQAGRAILFGAFETLAQDRNWTTGRFGEFDATLFSEALSQALPLKALSQQVQKMFCRKRLR